MPFHLLSKLYERTRVVITTNLSFSACSGVFSDANRPPRCSIASPITATSWKPGNDSFRFRASPAAPKARKEKPAS
ncbi:transposase [Novosphingobium sp. Rr 2-17]|nr:transposase [Novosphingobium sp. Rr 2-17]